MAWFRCGGGENKKTFTWGAGALSKGINFENTGKIKFETLTQNIGGQINIYGTNDPNLVNNVGAITLLNRFITGSVGTVAEIELDKTYPYIIIWSVYQENIWSADVRITI